MIGEYLGKYMKTHGIMQMFVSKKTGIAPQKLGQLLKDKQKMTVQEYFNICEAIGINPMIPAKEAGLYAIQNETLSREL